MTTQWSPDTCDCVLQYDDPESGVATVISRCSKHAAVSTPQMLNTILGHNRNKNVAFNWVDKNGAPFGLTNNPRNWMVQYNRNAPINTDPILLITTGLTATQISNLQAAADTRFGAGKVVVS